MTVAGRPSVKLIAVGSRRWRRWDDAVKLFAGPGDDSWDADRELIARSVGDPWM